MMLDLTVIILTLNEEIHIKRCLDRITPIAKKVYIVDSPSTDNTAKIATECGAEVIVNKWPGSHAKQLNWALDNLRIDTEWILRLDADEYLTEELITELNDKLPKLEDNISAIVLPLKRLFMGRHIKHGTADVSMIRIFRKGKVRCEERLMDEHMSILEGETTTFKGAFVDDNINSIGFFTEKHNGYATKEAIVAICDEHGLKNSKGELSETTKAKRAQKDKYYSMPLFFRAFIYFGLRYFIRGGFLDGKEGFLWHFLQGWWYRTLVDAKIFEIKSKCGNNKDKIKEYIKANYNIEL